MLSEQIIAHVQSLLKWKRQIQRKEAEVQQ